MSHSLTRRAALFGILAAAASAAVPALAASEGPARPAFRYADADRCGGGSAFDIINNSAVNLLEVYIRQSGATGWGADRLGDNLIATGQAFAVDPGQGVWDILIVRSDGKAFLAQRRNACRIASITVTGDDTLDIG